jgi:hypothetical protein
MYMDVSARRIHAGLNENRLFSEAAPLLKLLFEVALVTVLLLLSYQLFVRHTPIGWLLNGRRRRAIHPTPDMM